MEWVNASQYREVLEENLLQSACNLRLGPQFIFQHDNDQKHKAKTTLPLVWDKSECPLAAQPKP